MEISPEKFNKAKEKAEQWYTKTEKVKCPYFDDYVIFNSEGFEHLLFKSWNNTRSREDQYVRLCLLPLAERVLKESHTLQEFFQHKTFVRVQTQGKWQKRLLQVTYYGFLAIINNAQIKIIVREVEGRQRIFYSLIPRWRTEVIDGKKKKALFRGNPEED